MSGIKFPVKVRNTHKIVFGYKSKKKYPIYMPKKC